LRGWLHTSAYLVPVDMLPVPVPPGFRLVRIGRRCVVGAAWVHYEPGGVLSYSELMATVLVRRGWRIMPTITHIWVDSEESRDGGRALWAIPKDLAEFMMVAGNFEARDEKGLIARGSERHVVWLPGRWPLRFDIAQIQDGATLVSPVQARAKIALARVRVNPNPDGPLAFLAGRLPLFSLTVGDFRMWFGRRTAPDGLASGPTRRSMAE
jgi:hypothetical protein